jgi:hypothetical protein
MSETITVSHNGLLNYNITTSPSPLQITPAPDDPSLGSLTINVSSNENVFTEKLVFSFDIGEGDEYLTGVSSGILCSASPSNLWQIAYEDNGNQAVFVVTPVNGGAYEVGGTGPTLTIYDIQISEELGAATFNITETTSTTNSNYQDRTTQILIAKAPAQFYVRDFACQSASVPYNGTAILCWEGTQDANTKYTMLWESQHQDVTGARTWQTPQLVDSTMFVLKVDRQYQGETFTKYLSLTVIVDNPFILTSGATMEGDLNCESLGVLYNANLLQDLTVSGNISMGSLTGSSATVNSLTSGDVTMTALTGGSITLENAGSIEIQNASGNQCVTLVIDENNNGTLRVKDAAGNTKVKLYVDSDDSATTGCLNIYNNDNNQATQLGVDGNGNGNLVIQDYSGGNNPILIGIDDKHTRSIIKLGNDTYIASDGTISSNIKHFVMPNPSQVGTQIWYACVEGPEAAAYLRGTAQLINGQALVELPQHFIDVAGNQLTTVMLTPLSADSFGLAVVEKSSQSFQVRELHKGTGTYAFDWEIKAVRRGMENYQVIRPQEQF